MGWWGAGGDHSFPRRGGVVSWVRVVTGALRDAGDGMA